MPQDRPKRDRAGERFDKDLALRRLCRHIYQLKLVRRRLKDVMQEDSLSTMINYELFLLIDTFLSEHEQLLQEVHREYIS